LYFSPSIIRIIKSRRMRWAEHVARMGEKRNAYRILVGKPEGKRLLGRPRRRWVDNIKMDLREIGWYGMVLWEPPTVQKNNSHRVAKAGDIYTLQIVAWQWNIYTSTTQPAATAKTGVVSG
jgi:hypothetical protein